MSATTSAGYAAPWASVGYFDPSAGSGYISNGELLGWLAEVTGNKWGQLREEMMSTEDRHELMEDLGDLKAAYDKAQDTKNNGDLGRILAELKDKYRGTQYEESINSLVDGPLVEVNRVFAGYKQSEDVGDDRNDALVAQLDSWSTDIQSKIDGIGRRDQLANIRMQELQGNISNQVTLASNLIEADDKSKSAIIMNMKG
jgi:hypothetical protein